MLSSTASTTTAATSTTSTTTSTTATTSTTSTTTTSPLLPIHYPHILASEAALYPTPDPFPPNILASFHSNSNFSFLYLPSTSDPHSDPYKPLAYVVLIPLKPHYWKQLLDNAISEAQIEPHMIWDGNSDSEIAFHFFHIERTSSPAPSLAQPHKLKHTSPPTPFRIQVLQDLNATIDNIRNQFPQNPFRILGFSGLAVSLSGINILYNSWNMKEYPVTRPISPETADNSNFPATADTEREYILRHPTSKQTKLVSLSTQSELNALLDEGYSFNNQVKMFYLTNDMVSPVWYYIPPSIDSDIRTR
ncbi:hypothetical protein BKA69DRAFT_1093463 [Paraphysoderma sedebokerense]|nr:hypothetical protein BKA69DRAFT_1093463 [Paraphysoderma sedebokerense]